MKNGILKFGISVLAVMFIGITVNAQDKAKEVIRERIVRGYPMNINEYGEVVIKKKKEEADIKINVEIKKDGEVLINGKPYAEFSSDEVAVILAQPSVTTLMPRALSYRRVTTPGTNVVVSNKAFLGVQTSENSKGAIIEEVVNNSPAEKAGLKKGDIITAINDTKIANPSDLEKAIKANKGGEEVTVKFLRNNKPESLKIKLDTDNVINVFGGLSEAFNNNNLNFHFFNSFNTPKIGIQAQDTEEGNGAIVLKIEEDSPAKEAGLKVDDLIVKYNEVEVKKVDDLLVASRAASRKASFNIEVLRNGKKETITIKLPVNLKKAEL